MDEARNHHSQQTNTRTENQTLHILTYKWELNNENTSTQDRECHTLGSVGGWGARGGTAGVGSWEGITLGEMPDVGHGYGESKPPWQVCSYATVLQDLHMYLRT